MKALSLLFLLLLSPAEGGTRKESSFKDPITGKTGLYTAAFASGAAPRTQGLLLFFHGSGQTAAYASVFESLEKAGREFKLIPVALQAPNQAVTWPEGPNAPNNRHVEYVASFLEREIAAKHPEISLDRLILVGFSAGSTFLSGDFLPARIRHHKGGSVMLCGGGGPVTYPPDVFQKLSVAESRHMPLYFKIQTRDFLHAQTLQGIGYWKSRGALVHIDIPEGGGHCAFDFETELLRGLRKILLTP